MRREVSDYAVFRNAGTITEIVLYYRGGGADTVTPLGDEEADYMIDLLRNERPMSYDAERRRLSTLAIEPVGEAEREPDLDAWLAAHAAVAGALVWQGAGGAVSWPSWSSTQKAQLRSAFASAWSRGQIAMTEPPPNQAVIGDLDSVSQILTEADAWAMFRAYVAHSLATEIGQWVGWSIAGDTATNLALLLDSRQMFTRRADGNYQIGLMLGRAVLAPPRYTVDFLGRNDLIRSTRLATIARVIEWCRDHMVHFTGAFDGKNVEDQWQYRGFPPVARVVEGTPFTGSSTELRHRTAGCWGTTGFLRAVLRTVNIPAELVTTRCNHALPHFPSEGRYLSHGDDPYNRNSREPPPPLSGEALLIDQAKFDAWFGAAVADAQVCDNIGRRPRELRGLT